MGRIDARQAARLQKGQERAQHRDLAADGGIGQSAPLKVITPCDNVHRPNASELFKLIPGKMPTGGILEWLVEQQGRGIIVSLVRESDLANEPDLLRDFAIYGDRAMRIQELDEQSHTVRFVLSFDQPSIRQALARWERLTLFSNSFQNLLDR